MLELKELELVLSKQLQQEVIIGNTATVSGGSINNAYRINTNIGSFFMKTNKAVAFPNLFETEAKGLSLLASTHAIKIPKIIALGAISDTAFLMLEWIESRPPKNDFWTTFGTQLAHLHQNTHAYFGLEENNYIGSLKQSNQPHTSWADFLIEERWNVQVKKAVDSFKLNRGFIVQVEQLYKKLDTIFPKEPPALVHGDLWSGNFMVGNNGEPVLIDPAVYYGHREMDLAMTQLFGGFDRQLYHSYHEQYPLAKGWEQRVDLCNLYPLLVHVNLFGGSYVQQVKQIISYY